MSVINHRSPGSLGLSLVSQSQSHHHHYLCCPSHLLRVEQIWKYFYVLCVRWVRTRLSAHVWGLRVSGSPTSAPWTLIQHCYLTFTHQAEQQSKAKMGLQEIAFTFHLKKSCFRFWYFIRVRTRTELFEHKIWLTNKYCKKSAFWIVVSSLRRGRGGGLG